MIIEQSQIWFDSFATLKWIIFDLDSFDWPFDDKKFLVRGFWSCSREDEGFSLELLEYKMHGSYHMIIAYHISAKFCRNDFPNLFK